MKFGVIVFPGSNCDHDAYHVISKHVGQPVDFIWHRDTDLSTYDAVIIAVGEAAGDDHRVVSLERSVAVLEPVNRLADGQGVEVGEGNAVRVTSSAGAATALLHTTVRD